MQEVAAAGPAKDGPAVLVLSYDVPYPDDYGGMKGRLAATHLRDNYPGAVIDVVSSVLQIPRGSQRSRPAANAD